MSTPPLREQIFTALQEHGMQASTSPHVQYTCRCGLAVETLTELALHRVDEVVKITEAALLQRREGIADAIRSERLTHTDPRSRAAYLVAAGIADTFGEAT